MILTPEERQQLTKTFGIVPNSIEAEPFAEGGYHILFRCKKRSRFGFLRVWVPTTCVLRVQKEYTSLEEAESLDVESVRLKGVLNGKKGGKGGKGGKGYPWETLLPNKLLHGYLVTSPYHYKTVQLTNELPYLGRMN